MRFLRRVMLKRAMELFRAFLDRWKTLSVSRLGDSFAHYGGDEPFEESEPVVE